VSGMLRNMNTDDFFLDDSEIDEARPVEVNDDRNV